MEVSYCRTLSHCLKLPCHATNNFLCRALIPSSAFQLNNEGVEGSLVGGVGIVKMFERNEVLLDRRELLSKLNLKKTLESMQLKRKDTNYLNLCLLIEHAHHHIL